MLIQTGSQELNKDSQTPLSTVTSSSLLEDTYILPKQPKDFICHHVLGLLRVSSCPSSAGINERAVPGRTFGVNLCFLLATNGAAESKQQHPYRQINLVIDPGASLLFTAGTERASQISQQRLVYTQYRKTYQRWPTGLKNTFTETATIAPNNAGAAALHALL